jgi:cell wall-associated NlpC family hydrolase
MKPNVSALDSAFQTEAAAQFPNEACGFVVAQGKKQGFVPCKNSALQPLTTFDISVEEYHRASEVGEIIGVWHSHPNRTNVASESDLVECEASELPYFITAVYKSGEDFVFSETAVYEPSGYELPYVGRPYHYGVIDCYSLVVDYYKREYGIELERLRENRDTRFWEHNNPLMEQAVETLGFEKLFGTQPEKGDLFLIQTGGNVANHVAIYLGDDMILHHCENRLSVRSIYGGYWQKHSVAHLRYPGLNNGTHEGNS